MRRPWASLRSESRGGVGLSPVAAGSRGSASPGRVPATTFPARARPHQARWRGGQPPATAQVLLGGDGAGLPCRAFFLPLPTLFATTPDSPPLLLSALAAWQATGSSLPPSNAASSLELRDDNGGIHSLPQATVVEEEDPTTVSPFCYPRLPAHVPSPPELPPLPTQAWGRGTIQSTTFCRWWQIHGLHALAPAISLQREVLDLVAMGERARELSPGKGSTDGSGRAWLWRSSLSDHQSSLLSDFEREVIGFSQPNRASIIADVQKMGAGDHFPVPFPVAHCNAFYWKAWWERIPGGLYPIPSADCLCICSLTCRSVEEALRKWFTCNPPSLSSKDLDVNFVPTRDLVLGSWMWILYQPGTWGLKGRPTPQLYIQPKGLR
jgi:hypothetical protein